MANTTITIPAIELEAKDIIEVDKMAYRIVQVASSSSSTFVQLPNGAVKIFATTDLITAIRST